MANRRGTKKEPVTPASDGVHAHGFAWGNIDVSRTAVVLNGKTERGRVIHVRTPRRALEVYVTPTGLIRTRLTENKTGWMPTPRKDPRQLAFPWGETPTREELPTDMSTEQ